MRNKPPNEASKKNKRSEIKVAEQPKQARVEVSLKDDGAVKQPAQSEPVRDADWIAEASHELRLPIANLKLLIETLLDGGALEDEATARRMLSRAKTEIDRLQSLVVNLLSVEQSASRRDVSKFWVPLEARANYAVETTRKQASEKNIRLDMQVEGGFYIYANPEQLDQVVLNLVENAIKFTPEGGVVTIKSGAKPGMFSVEDTGIGMPAQEIPKIFQRFYRIDRAASRGSTGLGLSIVKHIADLHGAKISVISEEGRGSVFQLEFPSPRSVGASR
ncbi:MAG: HAMP domain-containing sensor histidine kinase [Candidatus Obscuribacterales bacterium]